LSSRFGTMLIWSKALGMSVHPVELELDSVDGR
jgi:hypothetical protein